MTVLSIGRGDKISVVKLSLFSFSKGKNLLEIVQDEYSIIDRIEKDEGIRVLWMNYQNKIDYAETYNCQMVIHLIEELYLNVFREKV